MTFFVSSAPLDGLVGDIPARYRSRLATEKFLVRQDDEPTLGSSRPLASTFAFPLSAKPLSDERDRYRRSRGPSLPPKVMTKVWLGSHLSRRF
jgi:hypothetical protein